MQAARMLQAPGEIFEMELLFIPELRALRQHPGFMELLDQLNVTSYWEQKGCRWSADRVVCEQT